MKIIPAILLFLAISFTAFPQENKSLSYHSKNLLKGQTYKGSTYGFLLDSVHVYRMNSDTDSALLRKSNNRYNAAGNLTYTDMQIRKIVVR